MKAIKTRTIKVFPKHTSANTQYFDMDTDDTVYIYNWLYRLLADMSEQSTYEPEFQREWFKRRLGVFPKGKNGPNSYASMLGGICSAKIQHPNKNLSAPQLDAVELFFDMIASFYADEEQPPTSVTFQKSLFSLEE
jgi:hypothetical protein